MTLTLRKILKYTAALGAFFVFGFLGAALFTDSIQFPNFPGSSLMGAVVTYDAGTYGAGTYGGADSVAPSLSIVTPISTPTTDTTPSFTFSTDDAGTITYGGACDANIANAALGNNNITLDALSAGTYNNCTIRVTDLSGNQSASLSIGTFTITAVDNTAPILSLTVAISSPTTDTTPEFTFTTDEAGTIAYSGACDANDTSAVFGANAITLDALALGTYSNCALTVTDAAGNTSNSLAINEFVVSAADATAPVLSLTGAISSPTTDTTPQFTFTSDEAGTIAYSGACSSNDTSAVIGENSITYNSLALGTYSNCALTVTDAAGNTSSNLSINNFTVAAVDSAAPTLLLTSPVTDPTTDKTPQFTFTSDEAGTIAYGGACDAGDTSAVVGNNTITLNTLSLGTYDDCSLTVTDAAGNTSSVLVIDDFTIKSSSSGGGPSGGGGGSSSSSKDDDENDDVSEQVTDDTQDPETTVTPPVVTTTPTSLPATDLFKRNISFIQTELNVPEDVRNLQQFLNDFEGESLTFTSIYDSASNEAMKRFQRKYSREILEVWGLTDATGYVGITSRLKMNFLLKGATAQCPVFTEFNGGLTGVYASDEVAKTKQILADLDMYNGSIDRIWTPQTHEAMVTFQETFKEVMLDPWNIKEGTGYKYKTTNKFLNYFAGCDTGSIYLEGVGTYEGI